MSASRVFPRSAASRVVYGRQEDLARLSGLFDEIVGDARTGVALVEGDAGIGKTRTVDEFARSVSGRGAAVLAGQCVDLGDEVLPYAPLVELLGELVRRHGPAFVAGLAGPTAGELSRLVPAVGLGDVAPETTPASVARLFQAWCSLIDRLAEAQPIVVIIEDVQWADSSTRDLLTLLVHQLRSTVMIVLTMRGDARDDGPDVRRFATAVERRADLRLVLAPLNREDQARQMGDILGVPPTTLLVDDVYSRADGNPFFAEELLALGAAAGSVPATVRELLLARVDALAPDTRQVLRAASLAGPRVSHRLLHEVADVRGAVLDEALRPAVERHVLVLDPADGGSYRFRHALLRESVASTCLPGESVRLHRRFAVALAADPSLAGDTRFVAGRVARHWYAADIADKALVASIAAAREAERALAFSEALAHHERAVELLDVVDDPDVLIGEPRYRLLWSAAETAYLAGHPGRAAGLMRLAIGVVDHERPDHHAYLHERLGRYLWMAADGEAALAAYEHAMELVEDEPVSRWRASIYSGYAQVLMLAGRFADSLPYARDAIRMAQSLGDARTIEGHARNNLGVDLAFAGHVDEGVAELVEARRIAEEQFDDVDDIGRAIVNLNSVLLDSGRLREAAEEAIAGVPVIDSLGLRRRKGVWCRCDAAQALLLLGRNTEALHYIREAMELSPDGIDGVRTDMVHGQVLLRMGEFGEARDSLERSRRLGERILDGQIHGPLYAALVEVATWQGDPGAALRLARQGHGRLLPNEDAAFCVMLFAAAASAAADLAVLQRRHLADTKANPDSEGQVPEVTTWIALAEHALARSPAPSAVADAHCQAARCELSRARGHSDSDAWGRAAARWDEVSEPYRAALARRRQAEALLEAGSDRPAAQQVIGQAWSAARRIGAAHLRAELEDLARRARIRLPDDSRATPAAMSPFRLTPREQEVLRLVSQGLADRQIGMSLFISHRTVERHVSNLLSKLGVTRRAELVALAHQDAVLTARVDLGEVGP